MTVHVRTLGFPSRPGHWFGLSLLLLLVIAASPTRALAQCQPRWLNSPDQAPEGVNGWVSAVVPLPNGDVLVGGALYSAGGQPAAGLARWDGAGWNTLDRPLQRTDGLGAWVLDAAVLANGDVVVCGNFSTAGGVPARGIARWNGSQWTAMDAGAASGAYVFLTLPGGDLVAGGRFVDASGSVVDGVARWDGAAWSLLGAGFSGGFFSGDTTVLALAMLPNGDLIAGGDFSAVGDERTQSIARWDGQRWLALTSEADGFNPLSVVYGLAVLPSGDLVAGGYLNSAGTIATNGVARWNGAAWSPMGCGMDDFVNCVVALPDGRVIAGGQFTAADGRPCSRIAMWDGTAWAPLGSGIDGPVSILHVLPNGDLIAGGFFALAGSRWVSNIARWDGASWWPFNAGLNGLVWSVHVLENGDLAVGGAFSHVGGQASGRVARWNGNSWSTFGSGIGSAQHSAVTALATAPDGDLIAAGSFSMAGGQPASNIARWNGSAWHPLGEGTSSIVWALAPLPNGNIVAGGAFSHAGGAHVNCIAAWNGTAWTPLGGGVSGRGSSTAIYAMAVLPNGDLIVAGDFTMAGSISASNIARWDGSAWNPLGLGLDDAATALAVLPNGDLVCGGNFAFAGGIPVNHVARWNGSSWSALGTGLALSPSNYVSVSALAVLRDGSLALAGVFDSAGTVPANNFARWDGTAWQSLNSSLNASVNALAVLPSGDLVAGGSFESDFVTLGYLARRTPTGIPWVARQPTPASVPATRTATLSAFCASGYDFNGPVTFQWRRNGVNIADGPGGASPGGGSVSGATGSLSAANLGATLTISGVQPSDAGEYTVVFTNACGSVTSAPATLFITPAPCSLADVASVGGVAPPDGLLTGDDFNAFIAAFAAGEGGGLADVTSIGGPPALPDGLITGDDFNAFIAAFAQGCP
ncbi:MAG: hypothetical protein LW650_12435 [Planctomycetaceae bacterium]|nr:hypothetical protein [Phycisphaerales bacterium]MCE2654224.1 hypothetical protein [Planctomycetaceae bacterium]